MKDRFNRILGISYLTSFAILLLFFITFFPMYNTGLFFDNTNTLKPTGSSRPIWAHFLMHHISNVLINIFIILFSFGYLFFVSKNDFMTSIFPFFRKNKLKIKDNKFSFKKKIILSIISLILLGFHIFNFVISIISYEREVYWYIFILVIFILTTINFIIFYVNLIFVKYCKIIAH
ncbi:hypothetical protein [Mycoplasma leonicaptivi]|uniref:hypothetical protein n=1 Tax=Mycoplasma leonicaptivi TaxID=36742 RepID=UPI0004848FB6|nr:hypothetical protein [Mycoplasma leonicaptivi]